MSASSRLLPNEYMLEMPADRKKSSIYCQSQSPCMSAAKTNRSNEQRAIERTKTQVIGLPIQNNESPFKNVPLAHPDPLGAVPYLVHVVVLPP